jgi:hypothetical protein
VNLEEARKLAARLGEANPANAVSVRGVPVQEAQRCILELADEVERMREHYHMVGIWCAHCGKPGYAKEGSREPGGG